MSKQLIASGLFLFFAFLSPCPALSAEEGEAEAILAAEDYLQSLDAGDYAGSWDATSDLHQAKYFKELYVRYTGGTRASYGALINRSVKKVKIQETALMLPDGQYFIIQYESSFENKKNGYESVTVKHEEDGKWRVCDYQMR